MAGLIRARNFQTLGQSFVRPTLTVGSRLLASKASGVTLGYGPSLLNVPETKLTTLKNGLRVATETSHSETATIGVYIDSGSRNETDKNNGASHFLEHLALKGTSKRSQAQLESEVEALGGNLTSSVCREKTVFSANILKGNVGKAVEILADITQNPAYSQVESARKAILGEMESVELKQNIINHLHATAFQGGHLARTALGSEQAVKSLTAEEIKAFAQANITAPRVILTGAGAVNHDELVKFAEQAFGGLSAEESKISLKPSTFVGSEVRIRDDEHEDVHIAFAVEGPNATSPDYFAIKVLQQVLGSWDATLGGGKNLSAKLAQAIAQHGLAKSYTTFSTSYKDSGLFGFYIVSDELTRLDDLMFQFQNDWVRVCVNATENEVERAKVQLKAALLSRLDSPASTADEIGRNFLAYGRRLSPFEINARIDAVDVSTVRKVAYKYLYDKDPAIVAFGPVEGFPDYNRIQTATSWLRV